MKVVSPAPPAGLRCVPSPSCSAHWGEGQGRRRCVWVLPTHTARMFPVRPRANAPPVGWCA